MTHFDFRALCAQLVDTANKVCDLMESYRLGDYLPDSLTVQPLAHAIDEASAALSAAPQQGAPSEDVVEAAAQVIYSSMRFDRIRDTMPWVNGGNSFVQDEARRCARAVLTRYGTQPVPVAVAERLPGDEDCAPWPDEAPGEAWCWFGRLIRDDLDVYFQWIQCWPNYGVGYKYTHWLPHWALPLAARGEAVNTTPETMTWTAAIMSDDNLDPDSLVGRMLGVAVKPTSNPDQIRSSKEVMPLWRVMEMAHEQEAGSVIDRLGNTVLGEPDRFTRAAEIEAVRDFIVPEELEPWLADSPDSPNSLAITAMYAERQRLRDLLAEQARIARGEP